MSHEAIKAHKEAIEELLPEMALHLPIAHAQKIRDLLDGLDAALQTGEAGQPLEPAADDLGAPPMVVETINAIHSELARRAEADVVQAATLERIAAGVERIAASLSPAAPAAQV